MVPQPYTAGGTGADAAQLHMGPSNQRSIGGMPTSYFLAPASLPTIFAQLSFSVTVRLKTGASGRESGSTAKYPCRSN